MRSGVSSAAKKSAGSASSTAKSTATATTFTAIERTTKLLLAFHIGRRTSCDTANFAERLRHAVTGRCQMYADGFQPYETVIPAVFDGQVDFAQLIKIYGNPPDGPKSATRRAR